MASSLLLPHAAASPRYGELSDIRNGVTEGFPGAPHPALSSVQEKIARGDITVNTAIENLHFEHASWTHIDSSHGALTIPITDDGSQHSNLTVLIDDDNNVMTYTEAHFTTFTEFSGHMTLWHDGTMVQDRFVTAPHNDISPQGFNEAYDALNRCLSNAGVPAWIIAAAGFVCTLGSIPGVIACLVASGVGGYTAGKCARAAVDAW